MESAPARALRIDVLGPLRAAREGLPLDVGPLRRQAVLVCLLAHRGQVLTQEQLLAGVWGADRPATGRQVLPSYVYALRRTLDAEPTPAAASVIQGTHGGYRLLPQPHVDSDLDELAALSLRAEQAREAGDDTAALRAATDALALFRGDPFAGLPGPFAEAERRRLLQRRQVLRQLRLESLVLLGRPEEALDELAPLAAADPYDESLAGLRMRALYAAGRAVDALNAFRELRRLLVDEQGIEPGEGLTRIQQAVLRRDDALLLGSSHTATPAALPHQPSAPRQSQSSRPPVNELPGDTGCFVGREAELALLLGSDGEPGAEGPGAVSLVTVAGIAGVGKTALAVRAAWQSREHYPDGVLFADLRAHNTSQQAADPRRVLHRLLRVLTGAEHSDAEGLEELVAAWRAATSTLRLLLVVDDAVGAEQVRPLIPAGPGSRVLVTSRKQLTGLDADRRVNLEPLRLGEAVDLFGRLLGAERTHAEPDAVRSLARRCDGLPLALRIAGARLQHRPGWTVGHLVERLADDERRLQELRTEDRSVEAAFRLTYDQLDAREQRLFRSLGQTPTTEFDALVPAAVLGCPPAVADELLETLVDASLVLQPRPGRYRLHDLVRAHARRLGAESADDLPAARAAALRLYVTAARMAGDVGPEAFPSGPEPSLSPFASWREAAAWLDASGADPGDAVAFAAASGEADLAGWIAESLLDHLVRESRYHECRTALAAALAVVEHARDPRLPASLRNAMGFTDLYQGRFRQSHVWFTEALLLARRTRDRHEEARALGGLGGAERALGDFESATARLEAVQEIAQELHDDWLAGMSSCNLGAIHHHLGRPQQALDLFTVSLTHAEKIGRPRMISKTLTYITEVLLELGDHQAAETLLVRAADLAREVADTPLLAVSLTRLGTARQALGDPAAALDLHEQALTTLKEQRSAALEMEIRTRLGATHAAAGDAEEALAQYRAALAVPGSEHFPRERALAEAALDGVLRDTA